MPEPLCAAVYDLCIFTQLRMTPGIQEIPIFFIVGRERSGTTLLQLLLDNHPNVVIPTESPFVRHLYNKHHTRRAWNDEEILSFYNDLLEEPYLSLWNIDRKKLKNDLLSLGADASFSSLCRTVYFQSLSAKDKSEVRLIGDKNPQYSLFIPQLLKVFPNARFIHITRDPRDQVMSMMKVNFEKKIISSLAYRWKFFNRTIEEQRKKNPGQFYTVKYEDLVSDPENQIKAITDFLGIPYTEAMLNTSGRAEFYLNSKALVKEHHESLVKPIDAGMIYGWKKRMNEKNVEMIDAVTGPYAEGLGYERKYKSASLGVRCRSLPGLLYGRLYFSFLAIVHALPYALRMFFFRKIISRSFRYWRESGASR